MKKLSAVLLLFLVISSLAIAADDIPVTKTNPEKIETIDPLKEEGQKDPDGKKDETKQKNDKDGDDDKIDDGNNDEEDMGC